jgi:hypothetical protein
MDRRLFLTALAGAAVTPVMTLSEKAEAVETRMMVELDRLAAKPSICQYGDTDPRPRLQPGQNFLQGHDPRLPRMPDRPTLVDFFKLRWAPGRHLLQSAKVAQRSGMDEETILACLLHDISVIGLIGCDHGWWGAQLVEPYVSERVSWAIRYHQALRFYADPAMGYEYPEAYIRYFGEDFVPEPYVEAAYREARDHRWYETSRHICINDFYAFDPDMQVEIEEFTDIIGRHFRQPAEGLGYDGSPVAHMWRTMIFPNNFL